MWWGKVRGWIDTIWDLGIAYSLGIFAARSVGGLGLESLLWVLTDGKCDGRSGAVVHVPAGANFEEFMEAGIAAFEAFDCWFIC